MDTEEKAVIHSACAVHICQCTNSTTLNTSVTTYQQAQTTTLYKPNMKRPKVDEHASKGRRRTSDSEIGATLFSMHSTACKTISC